jgi:hypothetical protein
MITNIAGRTQDGTLKTNASWWDRRGGSIKGVVDWIVANPIWSAVIGVVTIVGTIVSIMELH